MVTSEISTEKAFDIAFDRSIRLLDAEERYATSVDPAERKLLQQTIRGLNQKITPAAKKAALSTRYTVCDAWDAWLAAGNPTNVSRFFRHLNSSNTNKRNKKGSTSSINEGAIRLILKIFRDYSGQPGRPRK